MLDGQECLRMRLVIPAFLSLYASWYCHLRFKYFLPCTCARDKAIGLSSVVVTKVLDYNSGHMAESLEISSFVFTTRINHTYA